MAVQKLIRESERLDGMPDRIGMSPNEMAHLIRECKGFGNLELQIDDRDQTFVIRFLKYEDIDGLVDRWVAGKQKIRYSGIPLVYETLEVPEPEQLNG